MKYVKTEEEIAKIRVASKLAAEVLVMIEPYVVPGVSTLKLNDICHDYIVNRQKAYPAPLNYEGFPKSICTSVNHVVCHGIPSATKILKDGDIINIDITVQKDGFFGDTSKTFLVGECSIAAKRLVKVTEECLYIGIDQVKKGNQLGDIGYAIEQYAKKFNYSVVQEYCGHGIGAHFHENPQVLHFGARKTGAFLCPGMVFTIEPMINIGKRFVKVLPDNWTVVTKDHSLTAQFEHTVLVTDDGCEILTKI